MLLPLQSYTELHTVLTNSAWRAPIAAAVIGGSCNTKVAKPTQPLPTPVSASSNAVCYLPPTGGLMVIIFQIMSCAVLIRKSINKSGPSFGYGFIMAWYATEGCAICLGDGFSW
jgi:hypothetical protein